MFVIVVPSYLALASFILDCMFCIYLLFIASKDFSPKIQSSLLILAVSKLFMALPLFAGALNGVDVALNTTMVNGSESTEEALLYIGDLLGRGSYTIIW